MASISVGVSAARAIGFSMRVDERFGIDDAALVPVALAVLDAGVLADCTVAPALRIAWRKRISG